MFRVIDLKTGKDADISCLILEEWMWPLIGRDSDSHFAIASDGEVIVIDDFHKYVHCPPGRSRLEFNVPDVNNPSSCVVIDRCNRCKRDFTHEQRVYPTDKGVLCEVCFRAISGSDVPEDLIPF